MFAREVGACTVQVNPQMAHNQLTVVPGVLVPSIGFQGTRHTSAVQIDIQTGKISIYIIFKNHIYLVCVCVGGCIWHDANEEVRRQLVKLSSLLPCGFHSNSVLQQVLLPT